MRFQVGILERQSSGMHHMHLAFGHIWLTGLWDKCFYTEPYGQPLSPILDEDNEAQDGKSTVYLNEDSKRKPDVLVVNKETWKQSNPGDRMVRENCSKEYVSEPEGMRAIGAASSQCGYKWQVTTDYGLYAMGTQWLT